MFIDGNPHAVHDLWDVAAHKLNLRVTCRRCKHWRVFDAAALWWLFRRKRWNDHLGSVKHRFFCGVCWNALVERVRNPTIELVDEDPTGELLPMPSEYDWKQEARRRR